ncbi:MAG: PKD domain-containing protein [Bacteroidota bacterium]
MKLLNKGIKLIIVLMLPIWFTGCEDDDDATLPTVEAIFTHTINEETGEVRFINTSENADSFTWDFGDGTSSNVVNPEKTYPSGTYTIVLTAENNAGNSDTFEDTITIQIPLDITLPINFDDPLVDYDITAFNGASFEIVDNPDASGANDVVSGVGAITNSGNAFEGIFFDLGVPFDLTTDKSLTMKFWSQSPIDVLVKLENGDGPDTEIPTSHGGTGWENIYFTFDSASSFSRLTMFVDGPGNTTGTFYLDDIAQLNSDDVPCLFTDLELPIDFECNGIDYATKIVGDVSFTVVDNPELSGINSEPSMVGQITNVGNQFENAFFNLDVPVDFSSQSGIRFKLFSNQALPILLKFEDGTAADVEDIQMHSGSGWEELTFTLSSMGSYNDMVLFVDGPGNAVGTFFVDDFEQVDGTPPPPPFDGGLLDNGDFQTLDMNGNVTEWIQGVDDNDPAPVVTISGDTYYSIPIDTPDPDGNAFTINVSQKLEITQGETYELSFEAWSNVNRSIIAGIGLSEPDFSNTTETVNITTTPTRYDVTLTAANFGAPNARVLFDLAAEAGDVNIDDVRLTVDSGNSGGGGDCDTITDASSFPVDFESCEGFDVSFGTGQSRAIIDNPVPGGINTSGGVYQLNKDAGGNGFGGFQNIFNTGTFTNNSTITFKVYSTLPNQEIRLEIVAIPNPGGSIGNPAPYTQILSEQNQWVEMSFDLSENGFPNTSDETVYTMLVVKPGNVDPGNTPADVTFYFDDFNITQN